MRALMREFLCNIKGDMLDHLGEVRPVEWLYLFLFIFWMIYLYFVKDYGYWEQRKVPHVPAVFPFGSMTKVVVGSSHEDPMLDKIYKDFKGKRFVGVINIREPCLLLRDPELIHHIMRDSFEYFTDRVWLDVNPKDYLIANIAAKPGETWRDLREKLTPAYDGAHVYAMFEVFWKSSRLLQNAIEDQIKEGNLVDIKDVVSQFTMKLFAACAFGTDVNAPTEEDKEFYQTCQNMFRVDFKMKLKLYIYLAFPIVSTLHLFDVMDSKVSLALERKVRTTVQFRESTKTQKCDFINLLIKVRQNEFILGGRQNFTNNQERPKCTGNVGMTIEEIISETTCFFMLGHEKTSVVLLFCLYELARNEEIQERLFQEIQEVFKKYDNELRCRKALDEMIYLDQTVNETLRLYPVFATNFRKCTRDFKMPNSNLVIEKGLRLILPQHSIQHDSKYFPDPYTFDPDRFSAENCQKRHPSVFLPFGAGPRKCIGYRFGLMTVKLAVARLVFNFRFKLSPDTSVPLKFSNDHFLNKPLTPIKLIFTKR